MSNISYPQLVKNIADAYRTASGTTEKVKYGELASKVEQLSTGSFPVTVTFMNGTEEWAKVGVDGEGKIAEPTTPPIPEGYNYFNGWFDDETKILFPYSPIADKSLNATFGIMPAGAILYAPLSSNKATAETGQAITYDDTIISFENESGIMCAKKELSSNGTLTINNISTTNANWTFSFWLKFDFTSFLNNTVPKNFDLVQFNSVGTFYQYSGNRSNFAIWSNVVNREAAFSGGGDYKWHNYTIVSKGSAGFSVYRDGFLLSNVNLSSKNFDIGPKFFAIRSTRTTYGYISSVRIYDRVLTNDEINLLATEFTPRDR